MIDKNVTNLDRAEILTQALPYIQKYHDKIVVVKYGGNAMVSEELKQQVMEDIVLLHLIGVKVVLVHGGGPEITETLNKIGKESLFVDGLRVTDKETADVVQMVLAGKINKSLVNLIQIKDDQNLSYTQFWSIDRRNLESKDSRRMFYSVIDSSSAFASRFTDAAVDTVSSLSAKAIDGSLSNALIFTCWEEVLADGSLNPTTEVISRDTHTIDGNYAGFQKDKDYYIEINPRYGGGAPLTMRAGANSAKAILRLLAGEQIGYQPYAAENNAVYCRFDQSIRVK